MSREVILAHEAAEDLKALRAYERAAVEDAMERHLKQEATKTSKSRIKRLRGVQHPQYRLRVGDVRVFYDVTEEAVEVLAIIPKSEAAAWLDRYAEREPSQGNDGEET